MTKGLRGYSILKSGAAHVSATSTGTADIKTLAAPPGATAVLLSVQTNAARVSFDGNNPGAGAAPGVVFPVGVQPFIIPIDGDLKFASNIAGNSTVDALFLN